MMKRTMALLGALFVVALLRLAWVWIERYDSDQRLKRAAEARHPAAGAPLADVGSDLKILQFYATPGQVAEGERTIVCYGVANARAVRIEPPVETLWPSFNRCFWLEPKTQTTYTLVAQGFDGKEISASLRVLVNRRRSRSGR